MTVPKQNEVVTVVYRSEEGSPIFYSFLVSISMSLFQLHLSWAEAFVWEIKANRNTVKGIDFTSLCLSSSCKCGESAPSSFLCYIKETLMHTPLRNINSGFAKLNLSAIIPLIFPLVYLREWLFLFRILQVI